MNSTYSIESTIIESWFIPFDILMIVCSSLVLILASIFLFTIIMDKTCYTVAMMLIANTCISALIVGSNQLSMCIFALENDLQQIQHQDSLCDFRAYLCYVSNSLVNYSFLIQSIYRYITVIYPNRLFYQSIKFQLFVTCLVWIFSFIYCLAFLFTNDIVYNVNNQICQIPIGFSFPMIYISVCIYIIPVSMIIFIYYKLLLYVHQMSKRVTPINILSRARKELKMAQNIVVLITILVITGFPYIVLIFISFFTTPPKYHYRIAFICLDASLACIMIALFHFTEPLKVSLMKRIHVRSNVVIPTIA